MAPQTRSRHEDEQVQRRTDCSDIARSGPRPDCGGDPATLDADLQRIYGIGDLAHVGYRIDEEGGRRVLVVEAQEKAAGPDYLRFGLGLSSDFAGNAYFQGLVRYRRTGLNTLGAEWRTDLLFGRVDRLTSEFYQPMNIDQTFFVAPYLDFERKPFEVFAGRDRIARLSRSSGNLGFDLGTQYADGELRLGVVRGTRSFSLDTGPANLKPPDESINTGGTRFRLQMDRLEHGKFPRSGFSLSADVFASNPALGASDRYTRYETDFLTAYSRGDHTLQLTLKAGGPIGKSRLPNYDLFQFGGLMQLSGYRSGQLLGQSLLFGRAVYGHRLYGSPLLAGLFGGFSLELGRVNDPLLPSATKGTIAAGSVFVATDTPIGPVYLGWGHASGGNSALYLYLGVP